MVAPGLLAVALALLISNRAQATIFEDLYLAEVYVTGQNNQQLRIGARAGLLQVLIRVAGTTDVQQSSLIGNALRNPAMYYSQYSYKSTNVKFQIAGVMVAAKILRLSFEPSAIARLLRDAGFPVWGSNRPSILLWIALSDEQGRRLISNSDTSGLFTSLSNQASQRGLPIFFPLLDLEDEMKLSTAEVWGSFFSRIEQASYRYNPDCLLSGRIQKSESGQWTGNWSYKIDDNWLNFTNSAYNTEDLVAGIVNLLADSLAERYAIGSARSSVELRIESIDSLADYAAVLKYLQSLMPVLDSFVAQVRDSEVLFRLNTEGQIEQLIEIIDLDKKMLLINVTDQKRKLHYRWLL